MAKFTENCTCTDQEKCVWGGVLVRDNRYVLCHLSVSLLEGESADRRMSYLWFSEFDTVRSLMCNSNVSKQLNED